MLLGMSFVVEGDVLSDDLLEDVEDNQQGFVESWCNLPIINSVLLIADLLTTELLITDLKTTEF